MCDMTKAKYLKDPSMVEAINIWLWGVAANNEGELMKSGKIDITETAPYIDADLNNCPKPYHDFKQLLLDFF
jgi:hypothetical protein